MSSSRIVYPGLTRYATILDTYSISEILELNDVTDEEALDFLVTQGFITLPAIQPLDFDD